MTERLRVRCLALCAAAWGFAIGASLLAIWDRPAPPDQLPSLMTALGRDAHASFRFVAGLVVMTFVVPFAMRATIRLLAADDTRAWARNASAAAMLAGLWLVIISRDPAWTIVPPVVAIAAFIVLRHRAMAFTIRDAILVPVWATVFLGTIDMSNLSVDRAAIVATGIVIALRVAVASIPRERALPAPLCFAIAPLALFAQTGIFARDQRYSPWPALAIAILTPFILRLAVRDSVRARRRLRAFIAFVAYPIAAFAYMNATSLVTAEGKRRVDFFEDAQHLVASSEMLRGEKPYRDIVPPHGLIEDALLDYFIFRTNDVSLGAVLKTRGLLAGGNAIANYALAAAATGSPHAGILALFLSAMFGTAGGTFRALPAIIALALAVRGVRCRSVRMFAWSGAVTAFSILTSLDFGAYALVALIFAIFMFDDKLAALKWTAIGGAIVAVIAAIAMATGGILIPFLHVTLFEIAPLGPVYSLPPFHPPPGFRIFGYLPEAIIAIFHKTTFLYVVWILNLFALAAALAIGVRRRTLRSLMVISAFVVIACVSYAERHHLHFQFVIGPLIVATIWRMALARERLVRLAAPVVALLVIMMASPTVHLAISASVRRTRGPIEAGWTDSAEPRAAGAWLRERDAAILSASRAYVDRVAGPDGTFFDFTNRAMLYFLLNRDVPIRHLEPAHYETEALQREVIAQIENNPRVRAALVPKSNDDGTGVDIPNPMRAPLVWKYLQEHFQPDYEDANVVWWRRR